MNALTITRICMAVVVILIVCAIIAQAAPWIGG